MDLRRGINIATQAVVEELKKQSTSISTTEEIAQVSLLRPMQIVCDGCPWWIANSSCYESSSIDHSPSVERWKGAMTDMSILWHLSIYRHDLLALDLIVIGLAGCNCASNLHKMRWAIMKRQTYDKTLLFSQVGTISANGETEIGELIAKAMERVGKEGVITVEVGFLIKILNGAQCLQYSCSRFCNSKNSKSAEQIRE